MSEPVQPEGYRLREDQHPRAFKQNRFVYAVLSRRSHGVSVGINLNPDKVCNFDCIYCQVDRRAKPQDEFVDMAGLQSELRETLEGLKPNGALWNSPEFATLSADQRIVRDIAFSGDGEPTTYRNFTEIVTACIEIKEGLGFAEAKVVLITNATGLERADVERGLALMDKHNGEIWAKLDAGTSDYFKLIDNTDFPFARLLSNLSHCAQKRPLVIQSCFMRVRGEGPSVEEIAAYVQRIREILNCGGRILRVQVYTVARDPALSVVSSLSDAEVEAIARSVAAGTGLSTEAFYGKVPAGRGLMDAGKAN